jgi:hypothetical protein
MRFRQKNASRANKAVLLRAETSQFCSRERSIETPPFITPAGCALPRLRYGEHEPERLEGVAAGLIGVFPKVGLLNVSPKVGVARTAGPI